MKKTLVNLLAVCLFIVMLSGCNASKTICFSCEKTISKTNIAYCPYCGEKISTLKNSEKNNTETLISDSERIIGTWQHTDSSWGLIEYVFYSDGFCKGTYIGKLTKYGYYSKVVGVEPALYPDSYYDGSGDGYWYFTDNMLRIEYIGEDKGTMYHNYYFNTDGTELIIEGKGKYSSSKGTATWTKVD